MNYKLEKINKWLIILLILIQPIINIIRNIFVNDIQILGFSVFEMLNVVLVLLSSFITIYLYHNKKSFIKFLIFFILFLIYSIFHYINILNFNVDVYENYNPNFISEIYYLFRTFIISLLLILNIYYSNIKKQTVIRIVELLSLIISLVIVITNLFKIGFLSYGEGICNLNLFDWFTFKSTDAYSYYNITCKGLFSSANQISSIMFMTAPIILYLAYRKRCLFNYIVLILHTLSMFMLGTKTANIGILLTYIFFIVFYIILRLLKKTNHSIFPIIMIFLSFCILFLYSPFYHNIIHSLNQKSVFEKIDFENNYEEIKDTKVLVAHNLYKEIKDYDCLKLNKDQQNTVVNFFEKYSSYLGVSSYITKNYKVENHTNFWCDYIKNYTSIDYRNLKTDILNNIYIENNNAKDKYFGLGYSLNYIYTESDYTYQYYIYGIFGILIFILPYFLIILYLSIYILKDFKTRFNLENCMYLLGPILSLVIAYYSGHVLERTFPLLIMSLLVGLNLINHKKGENEEKIMFICEKDKHLKCSLKFKNILENYDYRIITIKNNNSIEFKKKHGRKIKYLFNDNKIFRLFINIFRSIYIYITFNPNTIVVFSGDFITPMCYMGKIFGSKLVFDDNLLTTNKLSNNIFKDEYILDLEVNKIKKLETEIIEIVKNPRKEKKRNSIAQYTMITFLLFFMIFIFSPLTGDDWGNYVNGYGKNLIESILYAKKCFFDYEGRFFSRVLLIYLTPKKFLCSFISACFVSGIYYFSTKLFNKKTNRIVYPLILISLLLIDVEAFNQGYQWIAGRITYLFPILFVFFLLYLNRKKDFKINTFKFVLLIFLTMIFSMFVETVSCGIIIVYFSLILYYFYRDKKINWKLVLLMIVSIIGTLLMRYSPGSLNRLTDYSYFDSLNILEKILYNFTNLIKYTLINNCFILVLLAIICTILVNKKVSNKLIKILLILYLTIIPVVTSFIYYLSKLDINLFPSLLDTSHKVVIIYWTIFSIIALFLIFKYLFKQKNYLITILFISAIGSNICMLISPVWGGRTSMFTDIGISIILIYILLDSIKLKKIEVWNKLVLLILLFLSIFYVYGYYNLYSDNIKREQIIYQQLNSDSSFVDIYKLSERFAWNPNPYGKGYLYKTIKLYYQIPEEYNLNLIQR